MQNLHPIESGQIYIDIDRQLQIIHLVLFNKDNSFNDLLTIAHLKEVLDARTDVIKLYLRKYNEYVGQKNYEIFCSLKKLLLDIIDSYNPEMFMYQVDNQDELINKINEILVTMMQYKWVFQK
jgi:hypothetical protein